MSEDTHQSQEERGSEWSIVTKHYLATLLCDDGPVIEASNESDVLSRAVKAHMGDESSSQYMWSAVISKLSSQRYLSVYI